MECGKVPFCCSCGLYDRHLHCSSSYLQGTSSSQASCTILGSNQPFNEGKGTDSLFEHIGHASIESSAIAECRVLNQGGTPIEDACMRCLGVTGCFDTRMKKPLKLSASLDSVRRLIYSVLCPMNCAKGANAWQTIGTELRTMQSANRQLVSRL